MKIVINKCFGGFSLSEKAVSWLEDHGLKDASEYSFTYHEEEYPRNLPLLVSCIEILGEEANGSSADLRVVEIPDEPSLQWHIHEYDGLEHVAEDHRIWS